jgi:MFS family permease
MSATPQTSTLAPFRLRAFRRQWSADLATSWAFEMENLALGWYILVETNSVLLLTLFASLQFLGTLLAPAFGVAGDRIGHRRLLCAMRAFFLVLAAALAALAFAGILDPVQAFVIAALAGLVRPSDTGLRSVLISATIPADQLLAALGLARITTDSARIGGALAGAGMVGALGIGWAYVMVIALYAISLLLTLPTRAAWPAPPAEHAPSTTRSPSPLSDLRAAVTLVWWMPPQLAAISLAFLVNLTAYPFMLGLLPYVAREIYHADQAALGYLVAASAGGSVIGSLLLSRLEHRLQPGRVMMVSAIVWQALTFALAVTTSTLAGIVVLAVAGFAHGFCIVTISALLIQNTPTGLLGRIMGLRVLAVYGLPIGLWLSGPLIERLGFAIATTIYGAIGLACTVLMLLRWRAHLWPADAPANRRR